GRADERERLERPRLGRAAEAMDRAGVGSFGRPGAQQRPREPLQLVRDRKPLQIRTEGGDEPELRRVVCLETRVERASKRREQSELAEPRRSEERRVGKERGARWAP